MDPGRYTILDVTAREGLARIPPCADPRFDHRTCDYWEDADRGSKAHRAAWLTSAAGATGAGGAAARARTPLPMDNPFAPPARASAPDPFLSAFGDDDETPDDNPFAPRRVTERPLTDGVPRKAALLDRGRGVFGSYAKVLTDGDQSLVYAQFGPLSAYPRALRLRDLYPQLPASPLPAVITCIATVPAARRLGLAHRLVDAVCADLAERGFAAVEAYPDRVSTEDETSAAWSGFWHPIGFVTVVEDERFPVVRRELA